MRKPTAKTAAKAPRAPRSRNTLSPLNKFTAMQFVKDADPDTPDADVAIQVSAYVGCEVSGVRVRAFRKLFGIPARRKPTVAQLYARIAQLETFIINEGYEVPAVVENNDA